MNPCETGGKGAVGMKILLVSDFESKFIWEFFDPEVFRGVDMIISCGDLKASYLSYLVTMIPAPLFYVAGNHDKSYAQKPPDGCISIDGRIEEYKGIRMLGFGGCMGGHNDGYEFTEEQMRTRVRKTLFGIKKPKFDILVTHAPARGVGDGQDFCHTGYEIFGALVEKYTPKYHFFGHQHRNGSPVDTMSVFVLGQTTAVNASGYKIIEY
jgi:uncharacterized protein